MSAFFGGDYASRAAFAPMRWIATVGKTFLICTGIAPSAESLLGPKSPQNQQNKVPRSFRVVTAVTERSVTNAGDKLCGNLVEVARVKIDVGELEISISCFPACDRLQKAIFAQN